MYGTFHARNAASQQINHMHQELHRLQEEEWYKRSMQASWKTQKRKITDSKGMVKIQAAEVKLSRFLGQDRVTLDPTLPMMQLTSISH